MKCWWCDSEMVYLIDFAWWWCEAPQCKRVRLTDREIWHQQQQ